MAPADDPLSALGAYDPFSEAARTNPYPFYSNLREYAPVHWAAPVKAWAVSRFADVRFVLNHPDLFSSDAMQSVLRPLASTVSQKPSTMATLMTYAQRSPFSIPELLGSKNLISADPPLHDRMRRLIAAGFTPAQLNRWEQRIRDIVHERAAPLRRRERFDVVADLAVPLPLILIAEMLGVAPDRLDQFKRWSDRMIACTSGSARTEDVIESGFAETVFEFFTFMRQVLDDRTRHPGDDFVSVLVHARTPQGERLSAVDVALFCLLLLVAGNETVTNLIGNAVHALLDHPDQVRWIRERPDARVPMLVEEALRYDAPIQFMFRRTTRAVDVGGRMLEPRSLVLALIGSANRDNRQFERAEEFDVTRGAAGHLAFGAGPHFCLGAYLARLEGRIALEALVAELPAFERGASRLEYVDSYLVRGLRSLEVVPVPAAT
jgi:cytochrome P450